MSRSNVKVVGIEVVFRSDRGAGAIVSAMGLFVLRVLTFEILVLRALLSTFYSKLLRFQVPTFEAVKRHVFSCGGLGAGRVGGALHMQERTIA